MGTTRAWHKKVLTTRTTYAPFLLKNTPSEASVLGKSAYCAMVCADTTFPVAIRTTSSFSHVGLRQLISMSLREVITVIASVPSRNVILSKKIPNKCLATTYRLSYGSSRQLLGCVLVLKELFGYSMSLSHISNITSLIGFVKSESLENRANSVELPSGQCRASRRDCDKALRACVTVRAE